MEQKTYTDEQMADIKERIEKAQTQITDILKDTELVITAEPTYLKIDSGVFATSFKIGYLDVKFNEKKEEGLPEEGPAKEEETKVIEE